jgi:hypothetical protein
VPDDRRPVGKIPLQRKLVPRHAIAQPPAGVPAVDLRATIIELAVLDAAPREVAEALRILPVAVHGDRIVLAMADPTNRRAIDEVEFVTGKAVQPRVAPPELLAKTIAAAYDARARGELRWVGPDADPGDPPSGIR